MIRNRILSACALAVTAAPLLVTVAQASDQAADPHAPVYSITNRFQPGADGGWDFLEVDSAYHLLYVTRGDNVQVIDTTNGQLLTTLAGLHGTHGVAIAPMAVFITNGKNNSVSVVDRQTHRTIATIMGTGEGPDAIFYEPVEKRIYTMNHKGGSVTVIDAMTNRLVSTIPALPNMESGVTDGKGMLFVNSESENKIAVIDLHSGKMVASWPLGDCDGPTGLAIDAAHHRLFSTCGNNKMVVVDSTSGNVVSEVPIGGRSDAAAFDAGSGMVYSSNGDGTLTVVHEDDPAHFRVVANVPTQEGARTMALDLKTHTIYLAAASYGQALDASTGAARPRKPMLPGSFRILVVTPTMH